MLIRKYTNDWITHFNSLKRELDRALAGIQYEIHHVGSTSVPGLDAKDIIDIDIVYQQQDDFNKIKAALLKAGYYHNGNQGIEDREVFKRIGLTEPSKNRVLDSINHHLYVCPAHSTALKSHLFFRDFLKSHAWARSKYQEIKYELGKSG